MGKTVLVVDDDPDFLELLEVVLTPEGYEVVTCLAPTEAYQQARRLHPDIVIVDLVMPGVGGWQVIEQIKADPATAGAQIIVCTAAVLGISQLTAVLRQWGCQVLPKPFELEDLLSLLKRAAARHKAS